MSPAMNRKTAARNAALRSAHLIVKLLAGLPYADSRAESLGRCERAARALLTDLQVLREEEEIRAGKN